MNDLITSAYVYKELTKNNFLYCGMWNMTTERKKRMGTQQRKKEKETNERPRN